VKGLPFGTAPAYEKSKATDIIKSCQPMDKPDAMRGESNGIEVFRVTLPAHTKQARELFLEYATSLGFSLCFQGFDQELKGLPGAYSPPEGRLLVARSGERAVGCIALRKFETGICAMKRLYVRPEVRGLGLGRTLVDRLIAEARAIGYERMRLDTIGATMQDAIALYRRVGFREIAPYTKIPVEGAVWMELLL
jgi:putative acetyltransferase